MRYHVEFTTGKWAEGPLEDWLNMKAEHGLRLLATVWVDQVGAGTKVMKRLAFIFEKTDDA